MSIMDQVASHLEGLQLRFRRVDDDHILISFGARNIKYEVLILARGPLLKFVVPEIAIVPERRVSEALRTANLLNLRFVEWGTFWIDPAEHQLGFELALPSIGGVSSDVVECAFSGVAAVDAFYPVFAKVIWAGIAVDEALASLSAEAGSTDEDESGEDELDEAV